MMSHFRRRLVKEVSDMSANPIDGVICYPVDETMLILNASVKGPTGTPYEQGFFVVELSIPENYPFAAPHIRFKTKVYHPNIDETGRVCLDLISKNWSPTTRISTILLSLQSLLANPNPTSPLVESIAAECRDNPEQFHRTARQWTKLHAHAGHKPT